jgi:hypothetical protein
MRVGSLGGDEVRRVLVFPYTVFVLIFLLSHFADTDTKCPAHWLLPTHSGLASSLQSPSLSVGRGPVVESEVLDECLGTAETLWSISSLRLNPGISSFQQTNL